MNKRIKKLRKTLDLTQQEFASRIGSVQNTITGYETGRRTPSNQVISLICKTFNVSETWLRTGEGEMFVPESNETLGALIQERGLSNREYILVERFLELRPEIRDGILEYCTKVAEDLKRADEQEIMQARCETATYRREMEQQSREARAREEARLLREQADAIEQGQGKSSAFLATKEA